jgi:hypothetical protein
MSTFSEKNEFSLLKIQGNWFFFTGLLAAGEKAVTLYSKI